MVLGPPQAFVGDWDRLYDGVPLGDIFSANRTGQRHRTDDVRRENRRGFHPVETDSLETGRLNNRFTVAAGHGLCPDGRARNEVGHYGWQHWK